MGINWTLPCCPVRSLSVACTAFFLCLAPLGYGNCVSLVKGQIFLDVKSCGQLNPEASFDVTKEKYKFIGQLPKPQLKQFLDSYRGQIVKGTVVKSSAVRSGLVAEKNALAGEQVSLFIRPGKGECSQIADKRISAMINEACCSGGGEVPCLLPSAIILESFEIIGQAASTAGDADRKKSRQDPTYQQAEKAFQKRDFAKAAGLYQHLLFEDKLDVKGRLQLGLAYRSLDMCAKAIPVLAYVHEQFSKKKVWADEEPTARKAIFLLARCYAKEKNADMAEVILDEYLGDPTKYSKEIHDAMGERDFGWINSTKEYQRFLKQANERSK